jgi:hypothetical protein
MFKRPGYSNYLAYCLENNFIRIGWPDVGDLRSGDRRGARANCYTLETIKPLWRSYLAAFCAIQPGSLVLAPNRDRAGVLYLGEVVEPYWFEVNGPYECSHRLGVRWDRGAAGSPCVYTNDQFGIHKAGWWRRAFHEILNPEIIARIEMIRRVVPDRQIQTA